jgi:hypothetical protein
LIAPTSQEKSHPENGTASSIACHIKKSYFLAEVSVLVVSTRVVSGAGVTIVVVSGVTVVVSLVVELSLLLLQATNAVTMIAIARNFFI